MEMNNRTMFYFTKIKHIYLKYKQNNILKYIVRIIPILGWNLQVILCNYYDDNSEKKRYSKKLKIKTNTKKRKKNIQFYVNVNIQSDSDNVTIISISK